MCMMYVMHKHRLKSKISQTINSLNENLTARINTEHVMTRKINIKG